MNSNTSVNSLEDLKKVKEGNLAVDDIDARLIKIMGIDNLIRFESEKKVLFIKLGDDNIWQTFKEIPSYFEREEVVSKCQNIKDYNDFLEFFGFVFNYFRRCLQFQYYNKDQENWNKLNEVFYDVYPELWISEKASFEVRKNFYHYDSSCLLDSLVHNPDDSKYFLDKDILDVFGLHVRFYQVFLQKFGSGELLKLITSYGSLLKKIAIKKLVESDFENLNTISDYEEFVIEKVYLYIKYNDCDYSYLYKNEKFHSRYPEIFLDFDKFEMDKETKDELLDMWQGSCLGIYYIKSFPILKKMLIGKDLSVLFVGFETYASYNYLDDSGEVSIFQQMLKYMSSENLFELCSSYGWYLHEIFSDIVLKHKVDWKDDYTYDDVIKILNNNLYQQIMNGLYYDGSIADFSDSFKDITIAQGLPYKLEYEFYKSEEYNFTKLKSLLQNELFRKYFKGKNLRPMLVRGSDSRASKEEIIKYFEALGYEDAMKLGFKYSETIDRMIRENHIDDVIRWYQALDKKCLPSYKVMRLVDASVLVNYLSALDHSLAVELMIKYPLLAKRMAFENKLDTLIEWYLAFDKKYLPQFMVMMVLESSDIPFFMKNKGRWINLLNIVRTNKFDEVAMLGLVKLAYAFGIFHGNKKGYKYLIQLFNSYKGNSKGVSDSMIRFLELCAWDDNVSLIFKQEEPKGSKRLSSDSSYLDIYKEVASKGRILKKIT